MADMAAQIDAYLRKKGSPLAGHGKTFVAAGRKWGVDPRLVVSISGIESSFGKRTFGAHNAWGWGPGRPFGSWEEGISTVTQGLKKGYISKGLRTPQQIVQKYAPGSDGNDTGNWVKVVSGFMNDLGGPPVSSSSGTVGGLKNVPKSLGLPASFDPHANVRAAALQNLQTISMGKRISPTWMLSGLSQSFAMDKQAEKEMMQAMAALGARDPKTAPATSDVGGNDAGIVPNYDSLSLGKKIGTPHGGTHTLGNWQSDNAWDISIPVGTPIRADFDGVIGSNIGGLGQKGSRFAGARVQVNGKSNSAWYGHLSRYVVQAGQRVRKGQIIGYSGSANGVPHLHVGYLHLPGR